MTELRCPRDGRKIRLVAPRHEYPIPTLIRPTDSDFAASLQDCVKGHRLEVYWVKAFLKGTRRM